jgi:hypothetical protein
LDKWYYGAKYGKDALPEYFWKTYFTSSSKVKEYRKIYGEPDVVEVRKTFGVDATACLKWEWRVLTKLQKRNSNKLLNKRRARENWGTFGVAPAINDNGEKLGLISIFDDRWGKTIFSTSTGRNKNKRFAVGFGLQPCEDTRWKTGEFKSPLNGPKGKTIFINNTKYLNIKTAALAVGLKPNQLQYMIKNPHCYAKLKKQLGINEVTLQ